MRYIILLPFVIIYFGLIQPVNAQQNILNYIKVYFSQPVDDAYSNDGVNAIYLHNTMFDTLAAYINRANYTVDIAQYEYKTYTDDPIATAINNAYNRGVKIRYIQDGSEAPTNSGVDLLNDSIPVIASPTGGNYNIMHDKFVVIDEYSPDTTKTFIWTGSPDWDNDMCTGDYNNVIIFQSQVLARAYTHEFNIMWGDTIHGGASNDSASLFGPYKPNSGTHIFNIGGSEVELYFSPSDSTGNHIIDVINGAKSDIYCGMFDFTVDEYATDILTGKNAGAFAAVILDKSGSGYNTPYTYTFPTALGTNFAGYVSKYYLYHNKYVVVNPSSPCDNPTVLTGSHNWTESANTVNDENTVIVHNDTIANLYLQAFAGDFKAISGRALTPVNNGCLSSNGINSVNESKSELNLLSNPYRGSVTINYTLASETKVTMCVYNILGQKIITLVNDEMLEAGNHIYQFSGGTSGIYILQVNEGGNNLVKKLVQVE